MEPIRFMKRLDEQIGNSDGLTTKLIIRFKSRDSYLAWFEQWRSWKRLLPRLEKIVPLAVIHAISCPVPPSSEWLSFSFVDAIEVDRPTIIRFYGSPGLSLGLATPPAVRPSFAALSSIPWGVNQVRAPQAWRQATGQNIRIGVIDTGIDASHPDLRHCIGRGINFVNRSRLPLDDNGHGTHIAGTIAGSGSYPQGVVGVAPRAIIHAVKAFDHNGSAYVSDIIAGIDWCVQNGLDIINMSFGMKTYNKSLELSVLNAYQAGKVIVASSGNDGKRAFIDYPARFPQVISVGATTQANKIAPFTNRGRRIDVFAPGEKIYSAWLGGKYHELSGTSMATSHVSGVIALMLSLRPGLKPGQIKELLRRSSVALSKKKTGPSAGRLHARRAINALLQNYP